MTDIKNTKRTRLLSSSLDALMRVSLNGPAPAEAEWLVYEVYKKWTSKERCPARSSNNPRPGRAKKHEVVDPEAIVEPVTGWLL